MYGRLEGIKRAHRKDARINRIDISWLIKQAEKVEVYEKELKRLYDDRYEQPKVVAELVKVRAYIFTCSYKTAWENWLDDDEKYDFTFEQIKKYF
ncbi:hypothetical protein [Paraliobacillus ryukyuensis]|uniref:hypothetical protein n=1 Tax=Paraliobacillus ryukyuensis TaxID=200904 RepID=UPI0009A795D4|nr:hypothetical protein [Paraliobacillus ryukyuensis]